MGILDRNAIFWTSLEQGTCKVPDVIAAFEYLQENRDELLVELEGPGLAQNF